MNEFRKTLANILSCGGFILLFAGLEKLVGTQAVIIGWIIGAFFAVALLCWVTRKQSGLDSGIPLIGLLWPCGVWMFLINPFIERLFGSKA